MYLTLSEAAEIASKDKGFEVTGDNLLRAGVLGHLVICCPLARGEFYNPISQENEFRVGEFFVIPPKSLLEVETFGETETEVVHAMDEKKTILFVKQRIKRDHLRVFHWYLKKFLPKIIDVTAEEKDSKPTQANTIHSTKDSNQGELSGLMKSLFNNFSSTESMWQEIRRLADLPDNQRPRFVEGLGTNRNKITIQFTEQGSIKEFTKAQFNRRFHDLFNRKKS